VELRAVLARVLASATAADATDANPADSQRLRTFVRDRSCDLGAADDERVRFGTYGYYLKTAAVAGERDDLLAR
jgi:hypothetical protein